MNEKIINNFLFLKGKQLYLQALIVYFKEKQIDRYESSAQAELVTVEEALKNIAVNNFKEIKELIKKDNDSVNGVDTTSLFKKTHQEEISGQITNGKIKISFEKIAEELYEEPKEEKSE